MSKKFIPKRKFSVKKNSSGEQSSKLLKTLQRMILSKEGSVNFVTVYNRLENIHCKYKDIKEIKRKSVQHVNLNPKVFEDRTPNDLVWLLECMKNDLRAHYYEIN